MYTKSLFVVCVACQNTHKQFTISKCETQGYLVNSVLCHYQHDLIPERV